MQKTRLKRLKNKIDGLSIRLKIYYTMILVLVPTVFFLVLFQSMQTRRQMLERAIFSANQELNMTGEKMSMLLDRVKSDSILIAASDQCQRLLTVDVHETGSAFRRNRILQSYMTGVLIYNPIYSSVVFYGADAAEFLQNNIQIEQQDLETHRKLIKGFINSSENEAWLDMHKSPYHEKAKLQPDCISFLRKIYDKSTGRFIGVMEMEVPQNKILELYSSLINENFDIFVFNGPQIVSTMHMDMLYRDAGNVFYGNRPELLDKGSGEHRDGGEFFYYVYNSFGPLDWIFVAKIPSRAFLHDINASIMTSAGISLIVVIFMLFAAKLASRLITRPINAITRSIVEISGGNRSKRVEILTDDETGVLAREFNLMLDNSDRLMRQITLEQIAKQEHLLSLMHMQMAPHFFYNFLENVCGLIVTDDKKTAIRAISNGAKFYRHVLSIGREMVTVGEEVKIAHYYLEICSLCNPGRYVSEIDIAPEIEASMIPKLTLQPLLENAIQHGVKGMKKPGRIKLCGYAEGGKAVLLVSDNGSGMENVDSSKPGNKDSFGLANTNERIRLNFGADYGISIDRSKGRGTTVRIEIPLRREKEPEHV